MTIRMVALPAVIILALLVPAIYILASRPNAQEAAIAILSIGCGVIVGLLTWAWLSSVRPTSSVPQVIG